MYDIKYKMNPYTVRKKKLIDTAKYRISAETYIHVFKDNF